VPDQRPLPDRRDGYEVMEVAPRRREERSRAEGGTGGEIQSISQREAACTRRSRVIVYVEPR
jgi:hypothetical protein